MPPLWPATPCLRRSRTRSVIGRAGRGKGFARERPWEEFVAILSRKSPVSDTTSFTEHAKLAAMQVMPAAVNATTSAAQQAAPLARHAVPLARNAGMSVKQGADGAVAWATPMADAARAWAAPRLEQSAAAISENLAPMISDALITAAHKIDTSPPRQKRHVVRTMLL